MGLDIAAQNQANYIKQGWGSNPHQGCNGNWPWDRISMVGTWDVTCGENVVGGAADPEEMVAVWLIDHNVPDRGHRLNIMNVGYNLIGVGIVSSVNNGYNPTVLTDFANGFTCNTARCFLPPMNVQYDCTIGYPNCDGSSNLAALAAGQTPAANAASKIFIGLVGAITLIHMII